MSVVTRIPPSPTGHLHIGTARTALFNYLYAKSQGGKIIFRSEDTDRARSKPEFEKEIIDGLEWLGLSWDSFSRQSEHTARYSELLHTLVASDKAYVSKEPAKDDPSREVEVVRLRNPGTEVIFDDAIRGPINTHTGDLGDFVIARSLDDALYHFAVVVDDMDGGVTHVIRGEDHISNTARQILIQEALGAPRPIYAHLPLILASDRSKMSKRHGAVSLLEYRQEGFLPEAIVNYLALLGWNPKDEREDFSLAELVDIFSLANVHRSGAVFDMVKFKNVNQRWMRKLSDEEFIARGALADNDPKVMKAAPLLKERATTFGEARALLSGEFACLFVTPTPVKETLIAKEPEDKAGFTKTALTEVMALIHTIPEGASVEDIKGIIMPYADKEGRGAVLWPLRYALSGAEKSPDPFSLVFILGKAESLSRIQKALAIL
ncbi:MAG TPA: glutamate--tRNA ligase family protein [Candidatus Paceibacterota bacterium]|nr:glutamate--tRNA ligase family protein [Candidatus Paceibacterota bacterium]